METRVYSDLALHGALVMSKNETAFPENPVLGTMVIKDYCLYAYIQLGTMQTWFPFSKATNSYVHVQSSASTTWIVQHNLGTSDVWFQVTDATGNVIYVGKTDIDENSFQLDFTTAAVGRCVVVAPDSINVPQISATSISVANDYVVIDGSGVLINGSYALTASSVASDISVAVAAEATLRSNADTTLQANIDAEETSRTNSDVTLQNNINTEITRASNAEATLQANIDAEYTRALAAEASIQAAVTALGNAFNYVATVDGGVDSGSAYDMNLLTQKDAGDYYKVTTSGYFKVGTGGTPFYANTNDGLTWNLLNDIDIIDNTNSTVTGTVDEVSVSGSVDTGYTISLHSTFSDRVSTLETGLSTEISRAQAAEASIAASITTTTIDGGTY